MMPPKTLLLGITVLSIVIIIAGVSWKLFNNGNNQPASTPSSSDGSQTQPGSGISTEPETQNPDITPNETSTQPSTDLFPQERIRDTAMLYIKGNHSETAQLMTNLSWVGGRDESGPVDTERFIYYSGNWTVTVEYPVALDTPTYTINGAYNSASMMVAFTEVCTNGSFRITSYSTQKYPPPPA